MAKKCTRPGISLAQATGPSVAPGSIAAGIPARARVWIDGHRGLVIAIAIGLAALAARLYALGDKPFWYDEVLTLLRSDKAPGAVALDSVQHNHMPTWFWLEWAAMHFGVTEFVVRLPAALFGAVCAGLAALVGTRTAGRWAGVTAGLLMALAPYQVAMGQEARSYPLVTCLIVVALWGLIRLLAEPTESEAGRPRTAGWVAYIAGTIGALYVLGVAIPWLAGANLAALVAIPLMRQGRLRLAVWWVAAQVLIVALVAPPFAFLAKYSTEGHGTAFNRSLRLGVGKIDTMVNATYLMRTTQTTTMETLPVGLPWFGFLVVALAVLGIWRLRNSPRLLAAILAPALSLPVVLFLSSGGRHNFMLPRYLSWDAAPYFILAGAGLSLIPGRARIAACAAIALLAIINLAPYYGAETHARWDLAAAEVAPQLRAGDVMLAAPPGTYARMFDTYAVRLGPEPTVWWIDDPGRAFEFLHSGHRLWVFYGGATTPDTDPVDIFAGTLTRFGKPRLHLVEGRRINIWLYDLSPAAKP
jgi:uncharacterized membrane protein